MREFNLGYAFCILLAFCFLLLGALLLRTQDMALPSGTAAFAAGIIGLYTEVLGSWSTPFVGSAAFAAMLGTCIACLDGFSRSFGHGIAALRETEVEPRHERLSLVLISLGALLLIIVFPQDIRTLLDFGNILSFCVAPLPRWPCSSWSPARNSQRTPDPGHGSSEPPSSDWASSCCSQSSTSGT